MNKKFDLTTIWATFFYIGKLPGFISYFLASLVALPITDLLFSVRVERFFGFENIFIGALFLFFIIFLISVKVCDRYEKVTKTKDPKEIVIDEVMGQMFCFILCWPWTALLISGGGEHNFFIKHNALAMAALGLINICIFRIFDTLKPWPIKDLEKLEGGTGIMMDDLGAAIYASLFYLLFLFLL